MNVEIKEPKVEKALYERVFDLMQKYIERHGDCKFLTEILEPSVCPSRLVNHDQPTEEFLDSCMDEELKWIEAKLLEQKTLADA